MDIEKYINDLILKYKIDRHISGFKSFLFAKKLLLEFFEKLTKEYKTIYLIGCQKTSLSWFQRNICKNTAKEYIVCEGNVSDLSLKKEASEFYMVVSYEYKDQIKAKLNELDVKCNCIYDIFESEHLYFLHDFYDIYGQIYHDFRTGQATRDFKDFDINEIFFWHRRNFELEKDWNIRRKYLEKIIFDCVYAKDFLLLKHYIDIYCQDYDDERYAKFYQEICVLLEDISILLKKRGQKDCLMIWLDALEYGEDENMPFLHGLDEQSIVFDNVYTVTPYTGATFKTLFGKLRVIEEKSFNVAKIGKKNSAFFRELSNKGYSFKYYGELDLLESEHIPEYYYSIYTSMTQMFWDILRDIVLQKKEEKGFFVLHEVLQTHIPYISLGLTGNTYSNRESWAGQQEENDKILKNRQVIESRLYVDKQLEFWNRILPKSMYKIYMSDHGHTLLGRFHTIMKICQKGIKAKHYRNLLSYYDFDKVILHILEHNDLDCHLFSKDYVIVQDVDYYYKDYILDYIKEDDFTPDGLIGYQGVITGKDMLISYQHGIEYYQKHENDEVCVTNERLNYLRSCLSKSKIDIYQEEKFKYSRIIWKAYQKCSKRTADIEKRKYHIIKQIFEQIPEYKIVAIRGGGIHTLRLLMILSSAQRERVSYIIDRNQNCFACKIGIKVLMPEDLKSINLDYIIVSSYSFGQQWKSELIEQNRQNNISIIDLYEELAKKGIICNKDFYKKDFIREDFIY